MAAHPKSNYKKNPFAEIGEIYYGKTLELISQCKIVLTSYSTALTWAVFLSDTDQYDHKRYTQAVAEYFQKKPINVSNLSFDKEIFEKEMKVNKKKYEIFKKDFIINLKDQNKTSYEIIYKNLKIL